MLDQGDLVMIGFETSPLLLLSVNIDRTIDIDVVDILLCVKLLLLGCWNIWLLDANFRHLRII
jgi:hypothetical protein